MGEIRIIAGKWRGRKIAVPEQAGLRPTPDRVRETVFNWLMNDIHGAHCLDAFAGTGALGFEALSRGAASVTMVDSVSANTAALEAVASQLQADGAAIYRATLPEGLRPSKQPFDIVFLDPPFDQPVLLTVMCTHLEEGGFLATNATIYLEARQEIKDNDLPENWTLIKTKKAGQVYYHLAYRESKDDR